MCPKSQTRNERWQSQQNKQIDIISRHFELPIPKKKSTQVFLVIDAANKVKLILITDTQKFTSQLALAERSRWKLNSGLTNYPSGNQIPSVIQMKCFHKREKLMSNIKQGRVNNLRGSQAFFTESKFSRLIHGLSWTFSLVNPGALEETKWQSHISTALVSECLVHLKKSEASPVRRQMSVTSHNSRTVVGRNIFSRILNSKQHQC